MSHWQNMSDEALLDHLVQPPGMSGGRHEMAKAMLDVRHMQAEAKSAKALVASTDRLVTATKFLGFYTLALVAVTIVLVLVTWRLG